MENNKKSLIVNCPLCEEKSLHIVGENEKMYQCISCGYMSSDNYEGTIADNQHFQKLDDKMKSWAKESDGRIWIPVILTLPTGLIYPEDIDEKLKWSVADLIELSEGEQRKYPIEGQEGKFYKTMYDVENKTTFDEFYFALAKVTGRDGTTK